MSFMMNTNPSHMGGMPTNTNFSMSPMLPKTVSGQQELHKKQQEESLMTGVFESRNLPNLVDVLKKTAQ